MRCHIGAVFLASCNVKIEHFQRVEMIGGNQTAKQGNARCQTVPFGDSIVPKGAFFEELKGQEGGKLNKAKLSV